MHFSRKLPLTARRPSSQPEDTSSWSNFYDRPHSWSSSASPSTDVVDPWLPTNLLHQQASSPLPRPAAGGRMRLRGGSSRFQAATSADDVAPAPSGRFQAAGSSAPAASKTPAAKGPLPPEKPRPVAEESSSDDENEVEVVEIGCCGACSFWCIMFFLMFFLMLLVSAVSNKAMLTKPSDLKFRLKIASHYMIMFQSFQDWDRTVRKTFCWF